LGAGALSCGYGDMVIASVQTGLVGIVAIISASFVRILDVKADSDFEG
jgi:hypothetical protein